jgi:hypothetical protein
MWSYKGGENQADGPSYIYIKNLIWIADAKDYLTIGSKWTFLLSSFGLNKHVWD